MTDSTSTDESIVASVQAGDSELFGELISRYEMKLKRYARKYLAREADIDDLVQDVFIKSYTHIQSFDTSLKFSPWIYRIAHNTFLNELKRKSRYVSSFFDVDAILPLLPAKETADADVLKEEMRAEVDSLLEKLQPKYKEVVILHYYEGLTYQEISDVLQIPTSTVGVRMTRARHRLLQLIESKTE